jgi:transposase
MNSRKKEQAPAVCPVCGEDVPRGALACPECGADYNSGWREDVDVYDGVDLPETFDYEEFAHREFGAPAPRPNRIKNVWWLTAIVLLVLAVLYLLGSR